MNGPSLVDVQRWFKSRIQPSAQPVRGVAPEGLLNPQGGVSGEVRLAVYAEGYLARICEALQEVYEAVARIIGQPEFARLAASYAARYPSHDYNLSRVGRHLPEWLASDPLTDRLPFLPDLARLEWLVARAFHAFEQPALDPTPLASWSLDAWDRTRLSFQPSVAVIASPWPIRDLWEARTRPRERINVDLVDRPQRLLVFRHGTQVVTELIDEAQQALLERLMSGRTLGAACHALAGRAGEATWPVADWFSSWTKAGLIVRCELVDDP